MDITITLLRLILFLFSSLGWWELLGRKSGASLYFLPALTVCTQVCILIAAGLLNCLLPAAVLMLLGGAAAAAVYIVREKGAFLRRYLNFGMLLMALGLVSVGIFFQGQWFFDYDNFSHWAVVVKTLLINDRFPNFLDKVIGFQEYPLGSSVFVYYFCRMVSGTEPMQMLAQFYMLLCFLLPLFKYITGHKGVLFVLMLLFSNFILCYDIVIEDLLVDTLLPLECGAMLLFILTECFRREEGVDVLWSIPFTVTAMQIKNPGVFYVAFACLAILIRLLRRKEQPLRHIAAIAAAPLSFYLWHTHCGLVFEKAAQSFHAMTPGRLLYVFRGKTPEQCADLVDTTVRMSLRGGHLWGLLAFLALIGLAVLLCSREKRRKFLCMLTASAGMYICYVIGLALMYLFSMGYSGEHTLPAFDRYRCSFFILLYYFYAAFFFSCASGLSGKRALAFILTLFAAVGLAWGVDGFPSVFHRYSGIERVPLQSALDSAEIPADADLLIIIPEDDGYYTSYLAKYLLMSDLVTVLPADQAAEGLPEGYDFLVVPYETLWEQFGVTEAVTALN